MIDEILGKMDVVAEKISKIDDYQEEEEKNFPKV